MLILILFFHGIGALFALHAILNTRTPQGTVAWAVSLVVVPYVAVPTYWVLGRSRFQGYVQARQTNDAQVRYLAREVDSAAARFHFPESLRNDLAAGLAAERVSALPFLGGNDVDLLIDGEETFGSILDGVDRALDYVLFQFFIIRDDELGRRVQSHLVSAAERGVRVYFLYDEVGSLRLPERYKEELRRAGVVVSAFNSRRGPGNRFQINFRNHRKIVVVDGRVAWVGGHNIGDEYMGRDPKFGAWRDTHARIEGPTALAAQVSFAEDWFWATEDLLDLNWEPTPSADGNTYALVVPTGPADELETANLMFVHAINTARERIWIASPYFVPDQSVLVALQLAGLRGVDVRILIPDEPDHLLVYLAAFAYFEEASLTGVRFYRYTDGFMHQKALLLDHIAAGIGTANFDNRSFRLNFEVTGIFADAEFVRRVERMFEADFARSREMGPEDMEDWPLWFTLAVRLARLTSPIQ